MDDGIHSSLVVGDLVRVTSNGRGKQTGVIYRVTKVRRTSPPRQYELQPVFGLFMENPSWLRLKERWTRPVFHESELIRVDLLEAAEEYARFGEFLREHVKLRGKGG